MSGPRTQLPALTGLRAVAAGMVLFLHASQNFPHWFFAGNVIARGYLGVDLFFTLSGFIITHVYFRDMVPLRTRALRVFLWHRFVRLFPAHVTVLIGLVALVTVAYRAGVSLNDPQNWRYADLPWHLLMVHAWGFTAVAGWNSPSWSISAEWFAYLLFPGIAVAMAALPRHAALPLAVATFVAGVLLIRLAGFEIGSGWVGAPALLRVATEFTCGALVYRALWIDRDGLRPWVSDLLAIGSLAGFCLGATVGFNDAVLVLCLAVLIAALSAPGPVARTVFAAHPVLWLGEISYSLYVVHFPVLLVLRHVAERATLGNAFDGPASLLWFAVAIAVVILAAAALYYFVEFPARYRLRDVFGRMTLPRAPAGR